VIREHKDRGGRVAAVLPVHYPRSLLRAFDYLPVEVWGPPGRNTTQGDTHLQSYACSVVRSSLAFLLSETVADVDAFIFPHCCDSMQGLGSAMLDFIKPDQALLPFYIPRDGGPVGVDFLAKELAQTYEALADHTGVKPNDEVLLGAIEREEEADALLAQLFEARPTLSLDDPSYFKVARSREYLPAEQFVQVAKEALTKTGRSKGVPLIISGMVPEPSALLDCVAEAGGLIVANDLACFGRRCYPKGESDQPIRRMAQRLLGGSPDSTKGSSIRERADHLLQLADKFGSKGVVFAIVKFCEPELFYLPILQKRLGDAGVRSLILEVDISDSLPHQVVTRLEAFLETMS